MAALNFKRQFMRSVITGEKRQTIRSTRKHPIKVNDSLYLYTGMRTKSCLRLRHATCESVTPISIYTSGCSAIVKVSGRDLTAKEVDELAKLDGFASTSDFLDFFAENHGPNFEGQLIKW